MITVRAGQERPAHPVVRAKEFVFAVFLMVVVLSIGDFRWIPGGDDLLSLGALEVGAFVLVPLLALYAVADPKGVRFPLDRSTVWLAAYVLWGGCCSLVFQDHQYSVQLDFKQLLPPVIAFVAFRMLVVTREEWMLTAGAYLVAASAGAVVGFCQFFRGGPYPVGVSDVAIEKADFSGETLQTLVTGFTRHPNHFAYLLAPLTVAAAAFFFDRRTAGRYRPAAAIIALVAGVLLVMTYSKGGILWAILGMAMAVALRRAPRLRRFGYVALSWVVIVAAVNIFALYLLQDTGDAALFTLLGRIEMMGAALVLLSDHPLNALFGGGMSFWSSYSHDWTLFNHSDAHNAYLNQVLLYGVVGLIIFLGFIVSSVRPAFAAQGEGARLLYPMVGALYALTGIFFFEPAFQGPIQKFNSLFLIAALISAASEVSHAGQCSGEQLQLRTILGRGDRQCP